ncbi:hypothetical protein HY995_05400 [Candidatus Micrarchaeota archaeon]|nr:hypothetical protein [Candidatus Micrarchaeota archaeon]MBI5177491.1 hypothetical protein [Candidatus Micrarchaeota archaeon]
MGKVMTVMKVFPQEGAELEGLSERVRKIEGCTSAKIEDFVFGAKIIKASFICEDAAGRDFEEEVKAVQGVSEVQVDEVGLL